MLLSFCASTSRKAKAENSAGTRSEPLPPLGELRLTDEIDPVELAAVEEKVNEGPRLASDATLSLFAALLSSTVAAVGELNGEEYTTGSGLAASVDERLRPNQLGSGESAFDDWLDLRISFEVESNNGFVPAKVDKYADAAAGEPDGLRVLIVIADARRVLPFTMLVFEARRSDCVVTGERGAGRP